jgi:ATP-binding cassette, subfamily B, bacterial
MEEHLGPDGRALAVEPIPTGSGTWTTWRRRWQDFVRVASRFWPYLRHRMRRLLVALACSLGYILMGLLEPWPMKLVLDNVILGQPLPSSLATVLPRLGGDTLLLLNVIIAAIILIAVVRGLFYYWQSLLVARAGQQIMADVRRDLYSHVQYLSFSFHDRRRTGDVLVRLTSDIRVLRDMLVSAPLSVTGDLFLVLGMAAVMFLMNWQLSLLALAVLPGLALLVGKYQGPMKRAMREQRRREGHLASTAAEALGAFKVVQGFRREQYEIDRFSASNTGSLRSGLKAARLEAKLRWSSTLAVAIVTAVVLSVAVRQVLGGVLSPGDLLVFTFYLQAFTRPLRQISKLAERSARATAAGERILEMLNTSRTVRDLPGAVAAPRFKGAISYENVSFAHAKGGPVLSDITLQIRPGERVAVVGPTGAGKTTLVNLLPRFYEPGRGRVCVDGMDVRGLTIASLREQIGLVFQEPVLFATTIAENIAYGKPNASREEIVEAAERAGIHRVIAALPEGYDTVIGERGGTLSGGQRQCVTIARAIIKDAPIVILDEPTTGLDSQSSALVMQALRSLMAGRTVIMISHELRLARDADRIVVLQDGRIVEQGEHRALAAREGLYSELERLQRGELTA